MLSIVLYYLCGVFAAAQLGKLAALAPLISHELHLGLAAMAALTSLLEVCGALLGGVAGRWLPRLGLRRSLSLALLSLALGAALAAFAGWAGSVPLLTAARLLESLGYLAIVVAAPVLIAQAASDRQQAGAMALWSTFVPVGMALGAWSYAHAAAWSDWRWAQGLSVVAALLLVAAMRRWRPVAAQPPRAGADRPVQSAAPPTHRQTTGPVLWTLVASFGAYAVAEVGLLALLPSLLTQGGMPLAEAAGWTALAALANVPGSALGAWLLRRGGSLAWALAASLVLPGGLFLGVYQADGVPATQAMLAVLLNAISGVFPSLVFALLPLAAGQPERLALASGRLTQFGASGALLGPPLVGAVVERWGWPAAGGLSLGLSLLAVPLVLWAWRRLPHGLTPRPASIVG